MVNRFLYGKSITVLAMFIFSEFISFQCVAEEFPASWHQFKYSTNSQNKKTAEAIENEAKKSFSRTCIEWGRGLRAKTETRSQAARRAYLLDKNEINGIDIGNARDKQLAIGMTICGVYAAYGLPDKVNSTERANSFHAQMIYRDRGTYVYVDSNNQGQLTVRSIQR